VRPKVDQRAGLLRRSPRLRALGRYFSPYIPHLFPALRSHTKSLSSSMRWRATLRSASSCKLQPRYYCAWVVSELFSHLVLWKRHGRQPNEISFRLVWHFSKT